MPFQCQPTTESEVQRLAALMAYRILDTPPEPEFDALVQLAAEICEVPIALISLIDQDRQWFKARVGTTLCSTPREQAFCNHTILSNQLLVVPDATQDKRFADNIFVRETPGIRFYAGAPLITPERYCLGTLCVVDHNPRELNPLQRQTLVTLSHQIIQLFELRRYSLRQEKLLHAIAWQQSHQVRRPLANILGLLHLLEEHPDPDGTLSMLRQETECLDRLIRDVVTVSQEILQSTPQEDCL